LLKSWDVAGRPGCGLSYSPTGSRVSPPTLAISKRAMRLVSIRSSRSSGFRERDAFWSNWHRHPPQPHPGKRAGGPKARLGGSQSSQQCSVYRRVPVDSKQHDCSFARSLTGESSSLAPHGSQTASNLNPIAHRSEPLEAGIATLTSQNDLMIIET
jgi:hypothetical protein